MPTQKSTKVTAIATIVAVLAALVVATLVQLLGNGSDRANSQEPSTKAASTAGACDPAPEVPSSPPSFNQVPDKSLAQSSTWEATLSTNCGDIVFELYGDRAPQTVASFVFLAEQGYWKDSPCHRLVPQGIFVLQCGDPTGTGTGDPGYGYGIENAPPDGKYPRGTLAMARTSDPNSNGGQFFVVYRDSLLPVEGGGYSIFGRVLDGMDIVDRIAKAGVGGSLGPEAPAQPISILDVSVQKVS